MPVVSVSWLKLTPGYIPRPGVHYCLELERLRKGAIFHTEEESGSLFYKSIIYSQVKIIILLMKK